MSSKRSSNASAGHHLGRSSAALFVTIDVRTPASRSRAAASTTGSLINHSAVAGPAGRAVAFRVMPCSSSSDSIAGHASAIVSSPRSMRCHGWSPSPSGPMSRETTNAGIALEVLARFPGRPRRHDDAAEVEEGCIEVRHGAEVWRSGACLASQAGTIAPPWVSSTSSFVSARARS